MVKKIFKSILWVVVFVLLVTSVSSSFVFFRHMEKETEQTLLNEADILKQAYDTFGRIISNRSRRPSGLL